MSDEHTRTNPSVFRFDVFLIIHWEKSEMKHWTLDWYLENQFSAEVVREYRKAVIR